MDDIKYVILDFGKVLFKPTTGNWFITPKFLELVDISKIDIKQFGEKKKQFNYLLSKKITNETEEYEMFYEFYGSILKSLEYPDYSDSLAHAIADDFVNSSSKYTIYDGVLEELENLSKEYKLILLTDNWPCVLRILDEYDLTKYFEKVYVSSIYGSEKHDGVFFDYPINDFDIKENEALFIDDNNQLLEIAKTKGLKVKLMDRENNNPNVENEVIHDLSSLLKGKNYR